MIFIAIHMSGTYNTLLSQRQLSSDKSRQDIWMITEAAGVEDIGITGLLKVLFSQNCKSSVIHL